MNILLDPAARLVIAHRGGSLFAPENTLVAFEQGSAAGADALELDVRLSADDVPVVIHDAILDRTTSGRGPVGAYTVSQLRAFDAGWAFTPDRGYTYPFRETGVRIPTLEEVLDAFPETPFVIELKEARAQPAVLRILADRRMQNRCVVGSFERTALTGFPRPPFHVGGARGELVRLYAQTLGFQTPRSVPYDAIFPTRRYRGVPIPIRPFLAAARKLAIPVHVWIENDPRIALALWRLGAAGIITDAPPVIVAAREQAGASGSSLHHDTEADGDAKTHKLL